MRTLACRAPKRRKDKFHRETAQCRNHFWLNDSNLAQKEGRIELDFRFLWIAIIGRAIFHDVGHVDIVTPHTYRFQQFVQDAA